MLKKLELFGGFSFFSYICIKKQQLIKTIKLEYEKY